MKKYWSFAKLEVLNVLEYRMALFGRTTVDIVVFYAAYFFWRVAYLSNDQIKGMSFDEMKLYLMLVFLLSIMVRSSLVGLRIQNFVKEGRLSTFLVKPVSILSVLFVSEISNVVIRTMVNLVLFMAVGFSINFDWDLLRLEETVLFFSFSLLVFTLSFLMYAIVGSLSFWIISIRYVHFLFQECFRFLSGAYIPLIFFPSFFQNISKYLPFKFLTDFPIQLYLGNVSNSEIFQGVVMILMWIFLVFLMFQFIWNKGLKKFDAVGL